MKNTIISITVSIWLTLSGAIWLTGWMFAGTLYLPFLDLFSFFFLYLPWMLLLGVSIAVLSARKRKR